MSALFIKLLNMSIAAGWLILAVIVLRFAFRKAPGWVRCTMWAFVALRLVIPFSLQSSFSVIPSVNTVSVVTVDTVQEEDPGQAVSQSEPVSASEPVSRPEYVSRPSTDPASSAGSVSSPAGSGSPHIDRTGTGNALEQNSGETKRIVINTGITAVDGTINRTEPDTASRTEESADIDGTASVIWAIGAALMLAYAAFSYLALWYRVRESIKENGVYICDNIGSPFVFGIIRPRIYIPSGMDEKNLAYVLAHEKAHIKRLDPVWRLLGFILLSVYWFAPLAWIAYVLFCRDIELACDERVIRTLDPVQRAGYSEALLELTQPHRAISACPVAFGETGVKERVKKVFSYKKPTVFIIAAALILCTVLGACLMTDPKDAEEPEYTKEIDMYLHSDHYIEFRIPEDTENIYTIAVKDGVISYRRVYETAGLRKTEDRVLIEKDGVLSLLFTDDRAYLNPTDDFSEVLSSARRGGTKKLVSHTQDGDTETFTFEKDGNTLAFIYEKGELKRMVYGDAGENGALTEREILLFTDKIPDDILFAVPDDYTYAAADTPEDAYGSTVEYCNHYAEYDIKDFDIAAYLEELNNKGFTATLTESADSCYAYINFGKDVVLVERFENAGKAAQAYRDYLRGVTDEGTHIGTMGFDDPPFRSAFRVNEYLFDVFHNFYYDTSTSFVAKMIGLLGINVPVYSGPENRIIKHIDRALDENFAVILTETGYTVVEQDEGSISSLGGRTWLVIAPDGSAATVVRCESKYEAEALVYAHRTTIESGKIPVTVAVLDGGCVVFVHHAAADAFISLITGVKTPDIPEHTDDGFFEFTLLEDGTYEITAKNTESIPSEVVIPSKHDGKNVTSIGDSAFYNCRSLTSVTIPDSVTIIGDFAFEYCSNLTSITIPDSVTDIGEWAFRNCSGLVSVTIPESVANIGDAAFLGCKGLADENGFVIIKNVLYSYHGGEAATIPDGVTSIGDSAFYNCRSLTSVTIPDSVTIIGDFAFYNCSNLTSITIPDSVTSIGDSAFNDCSSLTSVTIPDSVTSIGDYAFSGCKGLADNDGFVIVNGMLFDYYGGNVAVIPDSVTSIGDYAFEYCSNLTSITIPDSVTSIGYYAFEGCSSLESITIPDSITSIGEYAFYGCSGLTSVTIPISVTYIDDYAFHSCISLTEINFTGTKAQWEAVLKGDEWDLFDGDYVVRCTDGNISLITGVKTPDIPEQSSVEPSGEYSEESSQQPLEEYPELTMDDISVTGSLTFVSDKYPGKTLVYAGGSDISAAQTPYPFFIQGEELYVMHWKGEEVPVYDGTLVWRVGNTGTKHSNAFACVIGGWLNYDEYNGCRLMRFGELLIKYGQTDADGSPVYGTVYGFAPSVEISDSWILGAMYDKSALREGSKFFAFRSDGELYESPEWWYLVDTEGNLYTLPVPYEKRKSIDRIMFNTSSDAVDDVLVYVYETYPDMAEPIPVPYSANLNDCRRFEDAEDYVAYYTLSDAERRSYAVPSELSDFAPKTLTVYRSVSPAGEGDAEKALTSFIRSFDPAFESAAFETTGTGAVMVSYGENATLGFRDGSLWVNMAYGSLAPSSVWLTTGNLLDQDIPYLDEMIEYYGFDRSKLQVTIGDGGFYIAEYSGGMESAVEAIGAKCLHVSVSNNTVYAINACDRSAYDAEKRKAIPFSAAYKEFLKGNFIAPGLESEEFGEEEMYLLKADIIYASGIELKDDNEYVYPYYRFYISTQYDPAPLYAYIRAVED